MTLVEYDQADLLDCFSSVAEERQAALGRHYFDTLELGPDDEGRQVAIRGNFYVHAAYGLGESVFQLIAQLVDKR